MKNNYYLLTNLLNEEETRVVNSIVSHIEKNSGKVGIQQIANENFVSTAFIIKLCKRLGFSGYSELYYILSQNSNKNTNEDNDNMLQKLIDNYDDSQIQTFCEILKKYNEHKIFVVGSGFANLVSDYIVMRLAVCGFMVFNQVHFYDLMLFRKSSKGQIHTNITPSVIIAISQSGETESIINNVSHARKNGYKVISFSRRPDSTLAKLSDVTFIIDSSNQTLVSEIPNNFFGKVILAFEQLMGVFFE